MEKSADAFRTISEVADELKLPQHVLRFWETRFPQIKPLKRGGNRRFYRPDDVELLRAIKALLYGDGFTIKGVQRIIKDRGPRAVAKLALMPGRDARDLDPHRPLVPIAADFEDKDVAPDDGDGDEPNEAGAAGPFADEPLMDDDVGVPDLLEGLQAILFEVSECRRILASVRE